MPKPKNKSQYEILADVKYFDDITTLQIIMGIHRQSGACFEKDYYNQGEGVKENFISGMLTAFTSFESVIGEQLGVEVDSTKQKAIQYGDFTISIVDGKSLRIALISSSPIGNIMRDKCISFVKFYEEKHLFDLVNFSGDMDIFFDFQNVVDTKLDVKLNYKSKVNQISLDKYDGPRGIKKVLNQMLEMGEEFYPKNLPLIFMREASLSDTMAKYYTFDAYQWYVFDVINKK